MPFRKNNYPETRILFIQPIQLDGAVILAITMPLEYTVPCTPKSIFQSKPELGTDPDKQPDPSEDGPVNGFVASNHPVADGNLTSTQRSFPDRGRLEFINEDLSQLITIFIFE